MFIYTSPRDLFRENGLSEFDLIGTKENKSNRQALSIFYWALFAFPGDFIPGSEKAVTFFFEPHPVKRTEKNYTIFPTGSLGCQSLFYAAR